MDMMDKDYEKIFALKPIVPDTGQRNTRVFKQQLRNGKNLQKSKGNKIKKNEIGLILGGINIHGT
jgi:hypothetical protein